MKYFHHLALVNVAINLYLAHINSERTDIVILYIFGAIIWVIVWLTYEKRNWKNE